MRLDALLVELGGKVASAARRGFWFQLVAGGEEALHAFGDDLALVERRFCPPRTSRPRHAGVLGLFGAEGEHRFDRVVDRVLSFSSGT